MGYLSSDISKIDNSCADRRKASTPVEQDRRSGVDRRTAPRIEQEREHHHNKLSYAFEALPPIRRLFCVPDKISDGEATAALGAASLAFINLPEDLRDIKEAGKQIKSLIKHGKYEGKYDYKDYQHKFSFFRGTLLHDFVDTEKTKHPELAEKLLEMDKTLYNTKWGNKFLKFLNVKRKELIDTTMKDIKYTELNPVFVSAYKFEGMGKFAKFGEMTARAMTRTTLPGIAVLALIETPSLIKTMTNEGNLSEKIENTTKQTFKSGINIATTTAGIAYGGAIGSKYGKNLGSIIGMGLGAILGNWTSKKIQNIGN